MRALMHDRYGAPTEVLRIVDVEPPTPGPDDVVVQVMAASLNPADWHAVRGEPLLVRTTLGLNRPKDRIPGCDFAGIVTKIGADVQSLTPGTRVLGASFGVGLGAYADLVCVPADRVTPWPEPLTPFQAAALPLAGLTALQAVRAAGEIGRGNRVLVIGASGGVGTFAVQLAARSGADVVGVASTRNLDLLRELGVHEVIDYTSSSLHDLARGSFDAVLQLGGQAGPRELRPLISRSGTLVQVGGDSKGRVVGPLGRVLHGALLSRVVPQTIRTLTVAPDQADLAELAELAAAGELRVVGDQQIRLTEVPAKIEAMQHGHTVGKIVAQLDAG